MEENIKTVEDAARFFKEKGVTKENGTVVLAKPAYLEFMAGCGIPKKAVDQVTQANSMLIEAGVEVATGVLTSKINEGKKAGKNPKENPVDSRVIVETSDGRIEIAQTSYRTRPNNMAGPGQMSESFGRTTVNQRFGRAYPKGKRAEISERIRALIEG
jgi:hypothetical protein